LDDRSSSALVPRVTDEIHGDIHYANPLPQLLSHSIHVFRRLTHLLGIADPLGNFLKPFLKLLKEVRWNGRVDAHSLILDLVRGQVNRDRTIVAFVVAES
jgi:hypothetical protein